MNNNSTYKRLFSYVLIFRKKVFLALIILICSITAQLSGPYVIKIIIDEHITVTEKQWYKVNNTDIPDNIKYIQINSSNYINEQWVKAQQIEPSWSIVRIGNAEEGFYIESQDKEKVWLETNEVLSLYKYNIKPVIYLTMIYILLFVLGGILAFFAEYILQTIGLQIVQKMRFDIMKHIQKLPVSYFDNTSAGQVVTKITSDTEAIKGLFMSFMSNLVINGLTLIGIFIIMFILDVKVALFCLIFIPIFFVLMKLHVRLSRGYFQNMRNRLAEMISMINEVISVMPIIKAFRREKSFVKEFEELNNTYYSNRIKQLRVNTIFTRNISNFIGALALVGLLWYFGEISLYTSISFGVFYALISYIERLFTPITGIFEQLTNIQPALISADRIFEFLDLETVVESTNEINKIEGNVRYNNVSFAYKDNEYVLNNINFEAKKGETIAIVGHTGSGKSSLVNLLLGFYEPNKGTIYIDDQSITNLSKSSLRRHMGIVLQDSFLFAGDIKFNVSLYNRNINLNSIKQAIKEVGAEDFIKKLPNTYDEEVLERGSTLSTGQRQLITFARALASNPSILILDEATANLDSETEEVIQQALKVLVKNRTTFIIAHRLSTIREADNILVLNQGEIVESGTHEELMNLKGDYFKMVQLQKFD